MKAIISLILSIALMLVGVSAFALTEEEIQQQLEAAEQFKKQLEESGVLNDPGYDTLDYNGVLRDPKGHWRDRVEIHGVVTQTIEEPVYGFNKTSVTLLVATDEGYANIIMAKYTRYDGETRILEGDNITLYGEVHGTKTYTTIMGTQNEVPYVTIDNVHIN